MVRITSPVVLSRSCKPTAGQGDPRLDLIGGGLRQGWSARFPAQAGVDVALRQSLWAFVQELNQAGHTIVLTTHYLEEAETLCNRIAMLKEGRLIALEDKERLLSRGEEARRVRFVLVQPAELPAELLPLLDSRDDEGVTLKLADHDQLEGILACMRMAGVRVKELRTVKTDLEDVFVSMMQGQGS